MTVKRMDNVGIVLESLDVAISFCAERACEQSYRLCDIRGSEGLLIGLAEELRSGKSA